ncbi:MAG: hypothetical protein EA392_00335 [Cryomorphaceae bacterium]|nr:MAG: hypothetical protein EA392_00335 [Cryomorphaceae bacterium]
MTKTNGLHVLLVVAILVLSACTKDRLIVEVPVQVPCECNDLPSGVQLIHYWSFNDNSPPEAIFTPTYTTSQADMMYYGQSGAFEFCDGATQSCWETVNDGTDINARNGASDGLSLRLRNPGSYLEVTAPTDGYENIILRYATRRTGSGAQAQQIFYAADGSNFINAALQETQYQVTEEWELRQIDFSNVGGANNNPMFKVRIVFADGNENDSGNNRFDNLTFDGSAI